MKNFYIFITTCLLYLGTAFYFYWVLANWSSLTSESGGGLMCLGILMLATPLAVMYSLKEVLRN